VLSDKRLECYHSNPYNSSDILNILYSIHIAMEWYDPDEYAEHLRRLDRLDMEEDIEFEENVTFDEWEDDWELDNDQKAIKDWETSLPRDDRDGLNISPKYRDDDSDIRIISTDGVYLMVHSFILKRSSYVS